MRVKESERQARQESDDMFLANTWQKKPHCSASYKVLCVEFVWIERIHSWMIKYM